MSIRAAKKYTGSLIARSKATTPPTASHRIAGKAVLKCQRPKANMMKRTISTGPLELLENTIPTEANNPANAYKRCRVHR